MDSPLFLHDINFLIRGGLYLVAHEFLHRIYSRPSPEFPRVFAADPGGIEPGRLLRRPTMVPFWSAQVHTGNWPYGQ